MCAGFDTYLWPNGESIVNKDRNKRSKWSARIDQGIVVVSARSENEARKIILKRHPGQKIETLLPTDTPAKPTPKAPKPKPKHPVQAKAKPATAPAVQATPENIKALAKEAITEYVREGIAAFMRGLFGAR